MGEIRSTLDLIMEKTKDLSLSPEEKEKIKEQEWLKKARGWIQKFQDGLIDMDRIKGEILEREFPADWKKLLANELIDGLDPDGDNQKRFDLINEILGFPLEPFLEVLRFFNQRVNQAKAEHLDLLKNQWSAQGFSGSAILPDLNRDPSWIHFFNHEKKTCQGKWRALIDNGLEKNIKETAQ